MLFYNIKAYFEQKLHVFEDGSNTQNSRAYH